MFTITLFIISYWESLIKHDKQFMCFDSVESVDINDEYTQYRWSCIMYSNVGIPVFC